MRARLVVVVVLAVMSGCSDRLEEGQKVVVFDQKEERVMLTGDKGDGVLGTDMVYVTNGTPAMVTKDDGDGPDRQVGVMIQEGKWKDKSMTASRKNLRVPR